MLSIGVATKAPKAAERIVELTPPGVTVTGLAAPSAQTTVPFAISRCTSVVCKAAVLRKANDGAMMLGWAGQPTGQSYITPCPAASSNRKLRFVGNAAGCASISLETAHTRCNRHCHTFAADAELLCLCIFTVVS